MDDVYVSIKVSCRKQSKITTSTSAFVVTKILAGAGIVVKPVEILLSPSLITMKNLVAVCYTLWAHVGGPSLGWQSCLTLL